jgi:hypothetical protein
MPIFAWARARITATFFVKEKLNYFLLYANYLAAKQYRGKRKIQGFNFTSRWLKI